GDEPVRIFAEALEPPIPDVAVDVGGEARRLDEQRHAPEGAEDEAEREAAPPRSTDAPEESEREKVTAAGDDRPGDEEDRPLPHFDEGEREHGDRDHAAAEEPSMRTRRADEGVTPVGRRSDHEIVAFEERKGAGQGLRGEMGAVAIQRDDTPAPRTDEDAEGGLETGRETIALLRDHLDAEPACQLVLVAGGAHDRDSRRADVTRERERVLDEATVERDDRLRRQHVREAGVHVARARRLRHDEERAI